jgi:hypothetical protein
MLLQAILTGFSPPPWLRQAKERIFDALYSTWLQTPGKELDVDHDYLLAKPF